MYARREVAFESMKRRLVLAAGLLLLAIFAVRDFGRLGGALPWERMIDLQDFYCAGKAVLHGENPYALASLAPCELQTSGGRWDAGSIARIVVAAPQPPPDLAAFALLAKLPFGAAKIATGAVIIASVIVTACALVDLGVPVFAALAALALADAFVGLFLAQLYPVAIALLVAGAALLRRGHDALAGVLVALSLIEPQIGAPACVVLFIWASRTRIALAATTLALIVTGVLTIEVDHSLQWLTQVIPVQARAEATFWGQYSLTSVLAAAGATKSVALFVGSASYVAMLAISAWVAQRLAAGWNRRELLVFVPMAFSVIGGTYVHIAAIAAAVPLALELCMIPMKPALRTAAVAALLLLAVPWLYTQALKPLFFTALLAVATLCLSIRLYTKPAVAFLLGVAAALYLLALYTPPALIQRPDHASIGTGAVLASQATARFAFDAVREIAKIPTWAGLLGILVIASYSAGTKRANDSGILTEPAA